MFLFDITFCTFIFNSHWVILCLVCYLLAFFFRCVFFVRENDFILFTKTRVILSYFHFELIGCVLFHLYLTFSPSLSQQLNCGWNLKYFFPNFIYIWVWFFFISNQLGIDGIHSILNYVSNDVNKCAIAWITWQEEHGSILTNG